MLSRLYPQHVVGFAGLITLDLFSHWFQMYASLAAGGETHKASANFVVRLYYRKPVFFAACAGTEFWYLALYRSRARRAAAPSAAAGRRGVPPSCRRSSRGAAGCRAPGSTPSCCTRARRSLRSSVVLARSWPLSAPSLETPLAGKLYRVARRPLGGVRGAGGDDHRWRRRM